MSKNLVTAVALVGMVIGELMSLFFLLLAMLGLPTV
ncbi:MAG: hypothetical protein ACQZ3N_08950 [cyanobacterium endosymbiont of Rhopalodia yunnanensis]